MHVFVEALRLEGGIAAFQAAHEDARVPIGLYAVLASGLETLEGSEVIGPTGEGGADSLNLVCGIGLAVQADGHLTVSIFSRGRENVAEPVLVADALISASILRPSLRTTRLELVWNATRGVWVGDAIGSGETLDEPIRDATASEVRPPVLVITHRSDLFDPLPLRVKRGVSTGPIGEDGVFSLPSPRPSEAGPPETAVGGPTPRTPKHSLAAVPPDATLAQLSVPNFDPRGWLKSSSMPPGIGEHTVLEVLNLFLDGVAEQLGINNISTNGVNGKDVTAEAWKPDRRVGALAAVAEEHVAFEPESPDISSVTSPARSAAAPAGVGGESVAPGRDAEIGPSLAQLQRELFEVRGALAEQTDMADRRGRRCEDLQRRFEMAEREATELQAEMAACKRRIAWTESEAERQRQNQANEASSALAPRGTSAAPAGVAGHGRGGAGSFGDLELLYCVRSALRRVLLGHGDAPAIVAVGCAEVGEIADALRRHLDWFWRSLRSFWDAGALLREALEEAQRTPRAVATLAASGEPPWPESAMAPRAREAEQLVEALRSQVATTQKDRHAPHGVASEDLVNAAAIATRAATQETKELREAVEVLRRKLNEARLEAERSRVEGEIVVDPSMVDQSEACATSAHAVTADPSASLNARLPATPVAQMLMGLAETWSASQEGGRPSASTNDVSYPGGVSLRLSDYASLFAPVAVANGPHRSRMLAAIADQDFLPVLLQTYVACDSEAQGFLTWKHYKIHDFIVGAFRFQQLSPPSEGQTYRLFAKFDVTRSMSLGARECLSLADAAFRATFARPPRRSIAPAEQWASSVEAVQPAHATTVTYPTEVKVDFAELCEAQSAAVGAEPSRPSPATARRLAEAFDNGTVQRALLQTYRAHDRDVCGFLMWSDGGVNDFVTAVFRRFGLQPPAHEMVHQLFQRFADEPDDCADALACLCLVDALLRSAFYACAHMQTQVTPAPSVEVALSKSSASPSALGDEADADKGSVDGDSAFEVMDRIYVSELADAKTEMVVEGVDSEEMPEFTAPGAQAERAVDFAGNAEIIAPSVVHSPSTAPVPLSTPSSAIILPMSMPPSAGVVPCQGDGGGAKNECRTVTHPMLRQQGMSSTVSSMPNLALHGTIGHEANASHASACLDARAATARAGMSHSFVPALPQHIQDQPWLRMPPLSERQAAETTSLRGQLFARDAQIKELERRLGMGNSDTSSPAPMLPWATSKQLPRPWSTYGASCGGALAGTPTTDSPQCHPQQARCSDAPFSPQRERTHSHAPHVDASSTPRTLPHSQMEALSHSRPPHDAAMAGGASIRLPTEPVAARPPQHLLVSAPPFPTVRAHSAHSLPRGAATPQLRAIPTPPLPVQAAAPKIVFSPRRVPSRQRSDRSLSPPPPNRTMAVPASAQSPLPVQCHHSLGCAGGGFAGSTGGGTVVVRHFPSPKNCGLVLNPPRGRTMT
mmetsp:Transcript_48330/g.134993  ORF Transcript_48330/g.134993 Transcript_48330/m.134993 type:complete len:1454 (-) Transcript_48330:98-4459(-)